MATNLSILSTETLQMLRAWASQNDQSSSTWVQFREAASRWRSILIDINRTPQATTEIVRADAAQEFDDVQEAFLKSLAVIRKMECVSQKIAVIAKPRPYGKATTSGPDLSDNVVVDFFIERAARRPSDDAVLRLIAASDRLRAEFGDSVEEFHGKAEILSAKLRCVRR